MVVRLPAMLITPFGRQVGKTVNGNLTQFIYDGQDITASIYGVNTTHFVHGPGTDEHLAMVAGGQSYYYHSDGLGSIVKGFQGHFQPLAFLFPAALRK